LAFGHKGGDVMYSKKTSIINEAGLYGKSATKFIQIANNFKSTLFIEYEDKRANAKSLLGILSLALPKDSSITITGNGVDEKEAVDKLVRFIESGFVSEEEEEAIIGNVRPEEAIIGNVRPEEAIIGNVKPDE